MFTRAPTIAKYHRRHPFTIQLSFIINVIHGRISLQVACQEFISSENDYLVCIQNSGFCQLCPRLHRVFRLRMCARPRAATTDLVLNASLNLTVGGRRCFSYIKVAVSHGKLQLWGFKAETASILLQGFARLVNFCDKSLSVFLFRSYLTSLLFPPTFRVRYLMMRRNYGHNQPCTDSKISTDLPETCQDQTLSKTIQSIGCFFIFSRSSYQRLNLRWKKRRIIFEIIVFAGFHFPSRAKFLSPPVEK